MKRKYNMPELKSVRFHSENIVLSSAVSLGDDAFESIQGGSTILRIQERSDQEVVKAIFSFTK